MKNNTKSIGEIMKKLNSTLLNAVHYSIKMISFGLLVGLSVANAAESNSKAIELPDDPKVNYEVVLNSPPEFLAKIRKDYADEFSSWDVSKLDFKVDESDCSIAGIKVGTANAVIGNLLYYKNDITLDSTGIKDISPKVSASVRLHKPKLDFMVLDLTKDLGIKKEVVSSIYEKAKVLSLNCKLKKASAK